MSDDETLMLSTPGGDVMPALPEAVTELVASCVRFVHAATGMALDFTSETLPILDHYAAQARAQIQTRPEAAPLIAQAAGAYFGQVLSHEFGAFWHATDTDPHQWLVCCQSVYLAVNPIGAAHDILFEGGSHDGPSSELLLAREDREPIQQRLAAMPEVSPEDYYSFSTRFDVIQIAVEALRGEMLAGGVEDVCFDWSDYEPEFG